MTVKKVARKGRSARSRDIYHLEKWSVDEALESQSTDAEDNGIAEGLLG